MKSLRTIARTGCAHRVKKAFSKAEIYCLLKTEIGRLLNSTPTAEADGLKLQTAYCKLENSTPTAEADGLKLQTAYCKLENSTPTAEADGLKLQTAYCKLENSTPTAEADGLKLQTAYCKLENSTPTAEADGLKLQTAYCLLRTGDCLLRTGDCLLKTAKAESSGTFNPCTVFRKPSAVLQDLQQLCTNTRIFGVGTGFDQGTNIPITLIDIVRLLRISSVIE